MTTITFDSLDYFEKLKAAGVPEAQAKAQVEAMQEILAAKELATKKDIQLAIKELEIRLLKWQLGIGIALAAIMAKGFGWIGF